MHIYLAHAIDQSRGSLSLAKLVAQLGEMIRQQGHTAFYPAHAHVLPDLPWGEDDAGRVDAINRFALFESDGVMAVILPDIPSLGVPAEIEQALAYNRPVCIVTTAKMRQSSIQLASWARRGAQIVFASEQHEIYNLNVAGALCSLPDPSRFVVGELEHMGTPPLQASGAAANLTVGKYQGDAGIDLATNVEVAIPVGHYVLISTGVHVAIPDGYFGLITGRSSTWAKYQCDVRQAVIDSGYRGELMVGVENRGRQAITFEKGMRLAQIVVLPTFGGGLEWVERLPEHERAHNGYGSSGS